MTTVGMDHFTVDKSFYDLSSSDLKDFWDSDIESSLSEFKMCEDDWNCESMVTVKPHVILNDRLMSDAILEDTPIKVEHSYCSQSSPSMTQIKDELEDECLMPTILTKSECISSSASNLMIKSEPMSEPSSPVSSCPPSPTPSITSTKSIIIHTESPLPQSTAISSTTKTRVLKRKPNSSPPRIIQFEPSMPPGFPLPPTPPSSTSSDSEGNISPSHPPSPSRRMFLSVGSVSARQPIQTPLISSQPKGSTGTLLLTEEEKRTLLAEGYPIPVRLPLTKAEEKSLKKIRRKIKNKISAQESRRKKKEYMDALERKVQHLSAENTEYAKKINSLEDINSSLMTQVNQMQAVIARYQNESKGNAK